MKSAHILVYLVLFTVQTSCAQPKTATEWLRTNASELKTENQYDFSSLKKAIGDKRIIGLGESTHGLGSFYHLKSELVLYLHQELNFEVLAMEGGLGDIYLSWKKIDSISGSDLRDHSVFSNFRAQEADGLFAYLKSKSRTPNPLHYTGFDTQVSSSYFHNQLQALIRPYDGELADSLHMHMRSYQQWYRKGQEGDEAGYVKHRNIYQNAAKTIKEIIKQNQTEIAVEHQLQPLDFTVIFRALDMFAAAVNLSFAERYLGLALRDELMFQNLDWLLQEVYPDKKFIIWAHNGHVDKAGVTGSNIKWMGHYLKERYREDYYSLGLFVFAGEAYQFWTQQNIPFKNEGADFIEQRMIASEKEISFLNLEDITNSDHTQWLFAPVKAFELENGGEVSFVPTKRFDGAICIKKGLPPTYNE